MALITMSMSLRIGTKASISSVASPSRISTPLAFSSVMMGLCVEEGRMSAIISWVGLQDFGFLDLNGCGKLTF